MPNLNIDNTPITAGDYVRITKGCKAKGIVAGTTARVSVVTPLGAEFSHQCAVVLYFMNGMNSGKSFKLYARHVNRLADDYVNLNDGNPTHKVCIVRGTKPYSFPGEAAGMESK